MIAEMYVFVGKVDKEKAASPKHPQGETEAQKTT